jgi:hypothetical protein
MGGRAESSHPGSGRRSRPFGSCTPAFVALSLAIALGGCAQALDSMQSMKRSVFGEEEEPAMRNGQKGSQPSVYYVASDGVALYREPGKTIVTRLARYQKVYRTEQSRGYGFVRVDGSGEEGWIDNAALIWRLPQEAKPAAEAPAGTADTASPEPKAESAPSGAGAAGTTDASSPGDGAPTEASAAEAAPAPAPAAAEPAAPAVTDESLGRPTPARVTPSVFNPY